MFFNSDKNRLTFNIAVDSKNNKWKYDIRAVYFFNNKYLTKLCFEWRFVNTQTL